jgi:hypothetical protein
MAHDLTQGSTPQRRRDPEDRRIDDTNEEHKREKAHDKTLADSFPTSDPPSSIPDPGEADSIDVPPVRDIRKPGSDVINPVDKGLNDGGSIDKVA